VGQIGELLLKRGGRRDVWRWVTCLGELRLRAICVALFLLWLIEVLLLLLPSVGGDAQAAEIAEFLIHTHVVNVILAHTRLLILGLHLLIVKASREWPRRAALLFVLNMLMILVDSLELRDFIFRDV
jgi:hypothetical protein